MATSPGQILMEAWRICRAPFADLSGDGARIWGGRWNAPGQALVYAADTPALAVLEVRVHLDLTWDLLPPDYMLLRIDLGATSVERVPALPPDPVRFGTEWLRSRRSAVLQVPSVIIPESANLLINPGHPEAGSVRVAASRPFTFDGRLWSSA